METIYGLVDAIAQKARYDAFQGVYYQQWSLRSSDIYHIDSIIPHACKGLNYFHYSLNQGFVRFQFIFLTMREDSS